MRFLYSFIIILIFQFAGLSSATAQSGPHEVNGVLVQFEYGFSLPMHDLKERFGNFSSLGVSPLMYFHKPKISIGPAFHYHFGRSLKMDALSNIRDEYGNIIGSDTQAATVEQRMRALNYGIYVSKLFNFSNTWDVHGLEIGLETGMLQHWYRLQDDSRTTTQLIDEYSMGYDLLTGGMYIEPHIAYTLMSHNERLNFKVGVKYNVAFTKDLRGYNYNTYEEMTDSRTDGFFSFFFNYSLPIYFSGSGESRYY